MTLECPNCRTRYNIQDSLIPAQGARVKCKKCSSVITIPPPVVELAPQDLELIPPPGPAVKPPAAGPTPPAATPKPPAAAPKPPAPPARQPALSGPQLKPESPAPFERGFAAEPGPANKASVQAAGAGAHGPGAATEIEIERPFQGPATLPPPDPQFERTGPPPRFGSPPPFAESQPGSSGKGEPLPGLDTALGMPAPAVAEEEQAPARAPRAAGPAPTQSVRDAAAPAPKPPAPAGAESASPAASGSPIPAGLSTEDQSKHEKARRLARVLASDIAIYNREKRDRGIREGNLVAMLGYEIKKSWEIYKERVGAEFANSTPYFRDALNEMLAEGKKIF